MPVEKSPRSMEYGGTLVLSQQELAPPGALFYHQWNNANL